VEERQRRPIPSDSKVVGGANAPVKRTSADESQWYLISEDGGLSLRIVSGAILCEGENGELIVSPDHAAHAARFDIIEDELWLSCLAGRLRADGRVVTQHHHITSGVQLHIGRTRYFVASEINEAAPDVPLLAQAMQPGDTRLPKPSQRHIPVFYSGPLEIEEIVITESAEVISPADEAAPAPTRPVAPQATRGTTPQQASSGAIRNNPGKSGQPSRGKMTVLLLAGLGASIAFASWQVISRPEGRTWLAAIDSAVRDVLPEQRELLQPSAEEARTGPEADPVVVDDLAWLVWTQGISEENHAAVMSRLSALDGAIPTDAVRTHIDHYANRLIEEIHDVEHLEPMVMSLGPLLAPHPAYRAILATLENRLLELTKAKRSDDGLRPRSSDTRIALATPRPFEQDTLRTGHSSNRTLTET